MEFRGNQRLLFSIRENQGKKIFCKIKEIEGSFGFLLFYFRVAAFSIINNINPVEFDSCKILPFCIAFRCTPSL